MIVEYTAISERHLDKWMATMPGNSTNDEVSILQWLMVMAEEYSFELGVLGTMILGALLSSVGAFVIFSGVMGVLATSPIVIFVAIPAMFGVVLFFLGLTFGSMIAYTALNNYLEENNTTEANNQQKQVSNDNFFTKAWDCLFPAEQPKDTIYQIL